MKFIAIVATICVLSQTAIAQTGECKLIADATARLACYDKASTATAQTHRGKADGRCASRDPRLQGGPGNMLTRSVPKTR